MCFSSPNIPKPDPVQEVKQPDIAAVLAARKKAGMAAGGTLLTGPSGVQGAPSTGSTTLLGG